MPGARAGRAKPIETYEIFGVPRDPAIGILHVETIGARSDLHHWDVAPHRHAERDQYLFWRSGSAMLHLDEQDVAITAPAVVVIPMGCVHGMTLSEGADVVVASPARDFLYASAGPELASQVRMMQKPTVFALAGKPGEGLAGCFSMLLLEYESRRLAHVAACSALLRLILVALVRSAPEDTGTRGTGRTAEQLVARLRILIETTYRENRTIADYAADLGVSDRRLTRACREAADTSLLKMVLERRVMEAKRLLRFTDQPVGLLAYDLGFRDVAYFSRFFKERTLASPSAWREHHRMSPAAPQGRATIQTSM